MLEQIPYRHREATYVWHSLLEHMQSLIWEGGHIGQAYHYNIIHRLSLMCDWVALRHS